MAGHVAKGHWLLSRCCLIAGDTGHRIACCTLSRHTARRVGRNVTIHLVGHHTTHAVIAVIIATSTTTSSLLVITYSLHCRVMQHQSSNPLHDGIKAAIRC